MATKFNVDYKGYTTITREAPEDDSWERGDTETDYTFNHLVLLPEDARGADVILPDDGIKKGTDLYVLIGIYETGDSFGSDTASPDFIGVFKTYEEAEDVQKQMEAYASKDKYGGYSYSWPGSGEITIHGVKATVSFPWSGYFERFGQFQIERLMVR